MSKQTAPKKTFRVHISSLSLRDLRGEEINSTPPALYAKIVLDADNSRSREEVTFASKDGGKQHAAFKLHKGVNVFWYETFDLESLAEKKIYIQVWAEKNILTRKKRLGSTAMNLDKIVVGPRRQCLHLRLKDKVTGKLEFNISMTQICYDAQCLMSEVSIKGWNYSNAAGSEVLWLQHQYNDYRIENPIKSQIKERTTQVNEYVEEPTWRSVDLLTITQMEFPLMKKAVVFMKVSYEDPKTKNLVEIGHAKIPLPKYYHVLENTGVTFSEPLITPRSKSSDLTIEGKILFLGGPVLCQMDSGINTENRFVDPKYPDFPQFDFGRFETLSSKNLHSLTQGDIDLAQSDDSSGEFKDQFTLSEQDESPMSAEEKELQDEYQMLLFEKQKAVEFTQQHLLKVRDLLIQEIEANANLDNEIQEYDKMVEDKRAEIKRLEERLEVRKRGVSKEIFQSEHERPEGKMSWFEAVSDMNQSYRSLTTMDGLIGNEEESESSDSDFVMITQEDHEEAEGETYTTRPPPTPPPSLEQPEAKLPSPQHSPRGSETKIQKRLATRHATHAQEEVNGEGSDDDFGDVVSQSSMDWVKKDFGPESKQSYIEEMPLGSPSMMRSHTVGGTMYEVPTEVVNELMKNFEDERSVLNLLRAHGGDPDRVYEWLSLQLGIPPSRPRSPSGEDVEEEEEGEIAISVDVQ